MKGRHHFLRATILPSQPKLGFTSLFYLGRKIVLLQPCKKCISRSGSLPIYNKSVATQRKCHGPLLYGIAVLLGSGGVPLPADCMCTYVPWRGCYDKSWHQSSLVEEYLKHDHWKPNWHVNQSFKNGKTKQTFLHLEWSQVPQESFGALWSFK